MKEYSQSEIESQFIEEIISELSLTGAFFDNQFR